jgi:hypothetical protein
MNELSIQFILKIENSCIKECQKNPSLIEFKSCYNKCKIENKNKDELAYSYLNNLILQIQYPLYNKIGIKPKKNNQNNSSLYYFPDYYFKTKSDEMDVRNPKQSVGSLFGRNK